MSADKFKMTGYHVHQEKEQVRKTNIVPNGKIIQADIRASIEQTRTIKRDDARRTKYNGHDNHAEQALTSTLERGSSLKEMLLMAHQQRDGQWRRADTSVCPPASETNRKYD